MHLPPFNSRPVRQTPRLRRFFRFPGGGKGRSIPDDDAPGFELGRPLLTSWAPSQLTHFALQGRRTADADGETG